MSSFSPIYCFILLFVGNTILSFHRLNDYCHSVKASSVHFTLNFCFSSLVAHAIILYILLYINELQQVFIPLVIKKKTNFFFGHLVLWITPPCLGLVDNILLACTLNLIRLILLLLPVLVNPFLHGCSDEPVIPVNSLNIGVLITFLLL